MMRAKTLLSALALATGLVAGGALVAPVIAQDATSAANATRNWLSIPQIHDKLEAAGYTEIEQIERDRDGYEVKATDREGQRVELEVDPLTGEVTKIAAKRDKRKSDGR
ncbi:MAG TPA: PepSY domain-containing protein [Thauera phenylacetica]|jgi:hypothetical protein|nr:PepSY domain-containing protein [Thauera phenylacetica]